MTKEATPLHECEYEQLGTAWSQGIDGPTYRIKGARILISEDKEKIMHLDKHLGPHPASDYPLITKACERKAKQDIMIAEARGKVAKEMAGGEPGLEAILRWHMEFTGGRIESTTFQDIRFYQVGRNASHNFYAGFKDGKRYTYALGEDMVDKDETEESLKEKGYFIHYYMNQEVGSEDATETDQNNRFVELGHLTKLENGKSWGYMGHY